MSPADASAGRAASHTEIDDVVVDIWREVLGVEEIAVDDDFFALGGHSLTASRVLSRVRRTLGADVPLDEFLADPTVTGLAHNIALVRDAGPAGTAGTAGTAG